MSFRLYPKFVKGNPQLRIFLPNFWMKLVKPDEPVPPNCVHFVVPLEMTDVDVKNYLQEIYKVPVTEVRTQIYSGEIRKNFKNYLVKDDDYKLAFVTLGKGQTFQFPDLFPEKKFEEKEKERQNILEQAEGLKAQQKRSWDRLDVPSWFGI